MAASSDPISAFWQFWAQTKDRLARAIEHEGGMSDALLDEVGDAVDAIDPDLQWEFGPGRASHHHFCPPAASDARLYSVVERWLRAAPPADEVWELHAGRQSQIARDPRRSLTIGGRQFELDDVLVKTSRDDVREVLHVVVFHPRFASMTQPERNNLTSLLLDSELGEANVERWIGHIAAAEAAPDEAVPLPRVLSLVDALASEATGERHALLEKSIDGNPFLIARNFAVKRIAFPLHVLHVAVTFPFLEPLENGFPTSEEATGLNTLEDILVDALGDSAVWVARETGLGQRVIHFHAVEDEQLARTLDRFTKSLAGYSLEITIAHDFAWDVLDRW